MLQRQATAPIEMALLQRRAATPFCNAALQRRAAASCCYAIIVSLCVSAELQPRFVTPCSADVLQLTLCYNATL